MDIKEVTEKADKGDVRAQVMLGQAYYWGEGVAKSHETAFDWFSKAANQNYMPAETSLAYLYDHGEGVPKDTSKAFEWYLKAATQGDSASARVVAEKYRKGEGVVVNNQEAVGWYEKAAVGGDQAAQSIYGVILLNGAGVPKNEAKGFAYLINSSSLGYSRYAIAWCYNFGHFVPKDKVKSYVWTLLALESDPKNDSYLKAATKCESELSEPQIEQAKQEVIAKNRFIRDGVFQNENLSLSFDKKTTIPFKLIAGGVVISLKISDKKSINFLVDTGCAATVLDGRLASRLGLVQNDYISISGTGADVGLMGIMDGVRIEMPGMRIDGARVVLSSDFEFDELIGIPLGGILGFDILSHFVVSFDFIHNEMILREPRTFKPDSDSVSVPLIVREALPYVEMSLKSGAESVSGVFLIDSGDNGAVSVTKLLSDNHPAFQLKKSIVNGAIGFGGISELSVGKCDQLQLGGLILAHPVVKLSKARQGNQASIEGGGLGLDVLSRFDMTMDAARQLLYLKPNSHFNKPIIDTVVGFGFRAIRPDYNTFLIYAVLPHSPADIAGVKVGDFILNVDGVDAGKLSLSDIYNRIHDKGRHALQLKRGDVMVDVSLVPILVE